MAGKTGILSGRDTVRSTTDLLLLVLMGFLVFSPFSSILVMDFMNIPVSLPELLFLPFLWIFRKRFYFSRPGTVRTAVFLLIWASLVLVSVIAGNYSTFTVLSSSRTYLLLIISYLFFSRQNNVSIDDVMYVSLGSVTGWLFSSLYAIVSFLAGNIDEIARTGNMLAIPLLLATAIYRKNYRILIPALVLCTILSVTAGMRRQIAVFAVSLFLSWLFISAGSMKQFLKQSSIVTLTAVLFFLFLPSIERWIMENIPVLYYRVFEKLKMLISGDISHADSIRVTEIKNIFGSLEDYILPQGFVSRRTLTDGTGRFIDFPLSELFYMFGIVVAVILLAYLLFSAWSCFRNYLVSRDESVVFVILALVMFMLLFLEGTFLSSTYVAPVTGYCLGRLKYFSGISAEGLFTSTKVNLHGYV